MLLDIFGSKSKIKLDSFRNKLIEWYVKVGLLADEKPDTKDNEGDIVESDDEFQVDGHHESELDNDSEIEQESVNGDRVLEYAKDVISLELLYLKYRDAVKEGDGNRVECC